MKYGKSLLLAGTLALTPIAASANSYCEFVGTVAREAMSAVVGGMPIQAAYTVITMSTGPAHQDLVGAILVDVHQTPKPNSYDEQHKLVDEFGARWYYACITNQ